MRAATPGFIFVIVLLCMMAVTVIVDVIGLVMIIYHTFKQPFAERPTKKIGHWIAVILIMTVVVGFVTMIAHVYRYI